DLFYRLAVARVELPPLRSRRGDIPVLVRYLWERLGGSGREIPADLMRRFEEYEWPGNVRELRNSIARRLALGELAPVETARVAAPQDAETGDVIAETLAMDLAFPAARQRVVDAFERQYVERVLAKYGGNVAKAAAGSGIARRYFYIIKARQEGRDK
ncbi:MAG TPA: helix-turn-helix domain-containing protein, partial [Labilithrix sp.]